MTDRSTDDAWREAIARGLIAAEPAPRPLARGNADRKDTTRSSWSATLPDGRKAKLTLGRDLGPLAARQAALHEACPSITNAPLGYHHLSAGDLLVEAFFDGQTLESAASNPLLPPDTLRRAVATIQAALAATEQASSESARAAEWEAWTRRLLAQPVWQAADAASLKNTLLPALYQRLAQGPVATRWTNGDFLPANILLNPGGESRLIDAEFASRTHFYAEDAVRFQVLSSCGHDHPGFMTGLLPEPELSWHLYFWLRQFQLEIEQNTPAYLARVQTNRLGLIRCWAEQGLGLALPDWSVPATLVHSHLEEARWLQDHDFTLRLSGWCHLPAAMLRGVIAACDNRMVARVSPAKREDVQEHFGRSAQAALSGFSLSPPVGRADAELLLCAVADLGTLVPFHKLRTKDLPRGTPLLDNYPDWASKYDPDPPAPAAPPAGPCFSILLPVFNPPLQFLQACIESVLSQHYPRWELLVVNDGSTGQGVVECLEAAANRDARISVQHLPRNGGISRATNAALARAAGDYILLLDHDDLLRPHALVEFARVLMAQPGLDAVYSDEDKISADGRRVAPLCKPGFSPEFLRGVMYIGHALCVRTSVARSAGGFDPAFDGVQDYEFFLRVTERTRRIGHIPRMLYHWRQSPNSSALHGNIKGDMDRKQARAVQAHLRRLHDPRTAEPLHGHRLRLVAPAKYPAARIAVILAWDGEIPDHAGFWENIAASGSQLFARADTHVPPVIAVARLPALSPHQLLRLASAATHADTLVLLGTPFLAATPDWLSELATCAALRDSGCIAPLLVSADKRVRESGWTVSPAGMTPVMRGYDPEGDGYHGSLPCTREVAAVSSLCVAINRRHLGQSTGPSESSWWNFCLKVAEAGPVHRVCPAARLTIADARPEPGTLTFVPAQDAYFNPHFVMDPANYTLANPPTHYLPVASRFTWYFEHLPSKRLSDGCLLIRGWIYHQSRRPVSIRVSIGGLGWTVSVNEPRPDVARIHPEGTDGSCGYRLSLRLPAGSHRLSIEALAEDGYTERLWMQPVSVPKSAGLRRVLSPDPAGLVSFQMMAAPIRSPGHILPEKFPRRPAGSTARPKFSIVTPSFNQARFLGETMRSVLEQDAAVDYVVQDGGSSDGSAEIIRRFAAEGARSREQGAGRKENGGQRSDDRIQRSEISAPPAPCPLPPAPRLLSWTSEPDAGQADAIARGFAKTSGGPDDIMAWINSDDFYLPGALAYVADYFARHPEVDVVYGHRVVVDEASREIGRWFLPRHDDEVLRLNDFVPQETLFWRRRIWDKVGGIDPSFKFAMDWDLLLRFQAAGAKIVRVPYFLACFRVHAAQKTSARMHDLGQREIDQLRECTHGRSFPPQELEQNPRLLRYLRKSAFIEFLWQLGLRAP